MTGIAADKLKAYSEAARNMRPDCEHAQKRLISYMTGSQIARDVARMIEEHGPAFAHGFDDTLVKFKNGEPL